MWEEQEEQQDKKSNMEKTDRNDPTVLISLTLSNVIIPASLYTQLALTM